MIRLIVGLIMILGGVGGIESSTETFPLDSLAIALTGFLLMAWSTFDGTFSEGVSDV
jgi:hypothetical protein